MGKRRCKGCGEYFSKDAEGAITKGVMFFHSINCASRWGMENRAKGTKVLERERRADTRDRKLALKTRRDHEKDAQREFNRFIRLRDHADGCISCGASREQVESEQGWKVGGAWDCGHFLSVGSHPELRFDEDNAHKQCKACNAGSFKFSRKGRTVAQEYESRLVVKIGQERVDRLKGPHPMQKRSVEDLIQLKKKYAKLSNDLAKKFGG